MNSCIVDQTIDKFKNLLNEDVVNRLAHESNLVIRTGKLKPLALLIVMLVEVSLKGAHSLGSMCQLLQLYGSDLMTPQALSQRFGNSSTVKFLRLVFAEIFKKRLLRIDFQVQARGILGRFRNVYLEDSTSCQLHERVAGDFKGCGGGGSAAGFKIHTIWDAVKNCVKDLRISPSNASDQSQAYNIINYLKQGDLVLRDLGYFTISCFAEIASKGAYFLSRLRFAVKVYTPEGVLIEDIGRHVEQQLGDKAVMELDVLIGAKEQFPVRLVVARVNQNVYDQRVRKLRRKYRGNGRTPSKALLNYNKFTWFITNIPTELLAPEEAATLYKLRWQIELVFKSFKGSFQVDLIKGQSKNRVECFILSKLLAILVTSALFAYMSLYAATRHRRELSFAKFTEWILLHRYLGILLRPDMLDYKVMKMSNMDILSLCKQVRSRQTSRELLEAEATYYDIYPQSTEMHPLMLLA